MCTTGKFQSIHLFILPSCTLAHVYRPAALGHHKPRSGECVPPSKFQSIQLFTQPSCTRGRVYRPAALGHHKPRSGECVPPASSSLSIHSFCPHALLLMCTASSTRNGECIPRASSNLTSNSLCSHVLVALCTGPQHWGIINPEWRMCTTGRFQSPIDIRPQNLLFDPNLRRMNINIPDTVSSQCRLCWSICVFLF